MADAPIAVNDNGAPEIYQQPQLQQRQTNAYYARHVEMPFMDAEVGQQYPTKGNHEAKICGLRRPTFWLLIVLAIVVIGAVVGGAVGGMLAVQNAKSASEKQTAILQPSATSAPNLSIITTSTPTITPASSTSTSGDIAYTPLARASVSLLAFACPISPSTVLSGTVNNTAFFKPLCLTNLAGQDITGSFTYSFQDCLDACLTYNAYNNNGQCIAIAWDQALATSQQYKGNCWLKHGPEQSGTSETLVYSAKLCTSSSCESFVGNG